MTGAKGVNVSGDHTCDNPINVVVRFSLYGKPVRSIRLFVIHAVAGVIDKEVIVLLQAVSIIRKCADYLLIGSTGISH